MQVPEKKLEFRILHPNTARCPDPLWPDAQPEERLNEAGETIFRHPARQRLQARGNKQREPE